MKRIVFALASVLAFSAHADTGFKTSTPIKNLNDDVQVKFVVNTSNPELGRAWVEVSDQYEDPLAANDLGYSINYSDIKVPNLSYDSAAKTIIFKKSSGESIVCATNVRHNFFLGLTSDSTGKCNLSVTKQNATADDGFYFHATTRAFVSLNP